MRLLRQWVDGHRYRARRHRNSARICPRQSVTGPSAVFTYRRLGPHGGVPLVLLHRFRGTIDWWDAEFLDYLAADHDVIVFDNVGIGYSSGEPETRSRVSPRAPSNSSRRSACQRSTYSAGPWAASWRKRSHAADPSSCANSSWQAAPRVARFRTHRRSARKSFAS